MERTTADRCLRLCIDTNCVVSGLASPLGACGLIVRSVVGRYHRLLTTAEIEEEYITTLLYGRIGRTFLAHNTSSREAFGLLREIRRLAERVTLVGEPPPCRDEDDRKFLHCAVSGRADFLVTRDGDLLALGEIDGIPIMEPPDFVHHCRQNGWPLAE